MADPLFRGWTTLRRVICGGEPLLERTVETFRTLSQAALFNLYGPTETTITATCEAVTGGQAAARGQFATSPR